MARIPESEIERIKKETDLVALIQSRGVALKQQGANWIGFCPFHEDTKTPNLIVTPGKGLWRCMASQCGAAGNAIQFVEKFDGVSFRHAFELLANGGRAVFEKPPDGPRKQASVPRLACPLEQSAEDSKLLEQVANYYTSRLSMPENEAARDYLASRGLDEPELWKRFGLGVADRTLGLRIPEKNRKQGAELRDRLQKLGVYRPTGREHLNGCLVVPVRDVSGRIVQLYGRRIDPRAPKNQRHLYLSRPLAGIFNADALKQREIILCESIIDALSFICHGMEAATCTFGTANFTDELFEAIRSAKVESVRIAFDNDEAGERAFVEVAEKLLRHGIAVRRIKFRWQSDANELAVDQGGEALRKAVRDAIWYGEDRQAKSAEPSLDVSKNEVRTTVPLAAKSLAAKEGKVDAVPSLTTTASGHAMAFGPRGYRLTGLERNAGPESIKLTLRLECEGLLHLDQLDLCRDGDRRRFIERAAEETGLTRDIIKRDLGKILLACEAEIESRDSDDPVETAAVEIDDEQRAAALELLRAPDLLGRLDECFESAGLVGETTNRIAAYLACTSRLLDKPLAVIIQSTSAAGKTTLMEAVLGFFPSESRVKYSAMTGQSLYYLGEENLKHKVLAIVEEEGAEKASYALKLLQSEQELKIASTGKDPHSGRMETQEYHVEGPVAIVFTTTSIDIDEELMNRCLILSVDESREQTERIHTLQRKARTLEGLRLKKRRAVILQLLQNAQRLLKPVAIINPWSEELRFTAVRTRTRRDHEKYLSLIETITLLHQHQRPLEDDPEAGPHIRTTLDDIEAANRLAPEILGRSLDELPPQSRRMLDDLKALVRRRMEAEACEQRLILFSRRELREASGSSATQTRVHLERLEELEYVQRRGGRNGSAMKYELLVDAQDDKRAERIGLIDCEALRQRLKHDEKHDYASQADGAKPELTPHGGSGPARSKSPKHKALGVS